jgi:hypothetical protein
MREEKYFSNKELDFFKDLNTPFKIQEYLDKLPYSAESKYRCPRSVIKDKKAHCFDGALFAAAALRIIGYTPVIIDMIAERDDDHIIAIYKQNNLWGAVAKSNFVGLRLREPIYRSYRELVISYFNAYHNLRWEKSLRGYIGPFNLSHFDKFNWMLSDEHLVEIEKGLNNAKVINLFSKEVIKTFSPVDPRTYKGNMLGTDMKGVYKP